jgi:hypothetical protein
VPVHESIYFDGVDKKGAIKEHKTALNDIYEAGARLVAAD